MSQILFTLSIALLTPQILAFEHMSLKGIDAYWLIDNDVELKLTCDGNEGEQKRSSLTIDDKNYDTKPVTLTFDGQSFEGQLTVVHFQLTDKSQYQAFKKAWESSDVLEYKSEFKTATFDLGDGKPEFCLAEDEL